MRHYGILALDKPFNNTWSLPSEGKVMFHSIISFAFPEDYSSNSDSWEQEQYPLDRDAAIKQELRNHNSPCGYVFFLTCVSCDGRGIIGEEETSGGHKKQEECERCSGSGLNPEKLKRFESIKTEDEADDCYSNYGSIIKIQTDKPPS